MSENNGNLSFPEWAIKAATRIGDVLNEACAKSGVPIPPDADMKIRYGCANVIAQEYYSAVPPKENEETHA